MWFGTTPDDQLVDAGFPRRFVPRAFDAILRHNAFELLPDKVGADGKPLSPTAVPVSVSDLPADEMLVLPSAHIEQQVFAPVPDNLEECKAALVEARSALTEMRRQRDLLKNALDSITQVTQSVRGVH